MEEFGKYLRNIREKKNLTVNQLAVYSGVSSASISRIENNKRGTPKPATIKKLATALKLPYAELMNVAGYSNTGDIFVYSDEILTTFSKRLSQEMARKDLNFENVAEHCKVTPNYINELLNSPKQLPGVGTLYKLANLLDVTPDYLSGFTSERNGYDPRTPRPRDMEEFLDKEEVMLYGQILNEEDKAKMKNILAAVFMDAKKQNKRK